MNSSKARSVLLVFCLFSWFYFFLILLPLKRLGVMVVLYPSVQFAIYITFSSSSISHSIFPDLLAISRRS